MCLQTLPIGVDLCTELLHLFLVRLWLLEKRSHREYVPEGCVSRVGSAKLCHALLTDFQCSQSRRQTEALSFGDVWEASRPAMVMDRVASPLLQCGDLLYV
jgi:hypothetical protein